MNRNVIYAVAVLLATVVIAAFPTEAEGEIYEDTLRLHILANSDTEEDQALKLAVRDGLLEKYGEQLSVASDADEAADVAEGILDEIECYAEKIMRGLGYEYEAEATVSVEWYETRDYDDFSLPRGYYKSLRVIIGEGAGRNWWCVMYPPLCMDMASSDTPSDDGIVDYTREEILLVRGGRYNIKFKTLEILSSFFSKKH